MHRLPNGQKKAVIEYNGNFFDLALIFNHDKPGVMGNIATALGKYSINISRMQVRQDEDRVDNIVFLKTDTPIPDDVLKELRDLPMVITVTLLEL